MSRLRRGLFLLFFVVIPATLSGGCGADPKPATPNGVVWRRLGSWSGRGLMQTEAFISDTGALRLQWEARNATAPDTGTLRVMVHSAVSGRPLALGVEHRGSGRGTSYVNEDPREFYLVVDSSDLEWTVAVEEGFPLTTVAPRER